MIRRIIIAIFLLISILVFTVGIPLVINECYKVGGYITLWNASDVLAYYGSLLGSVTAIAVLAGTIVFTRKQIQRETYIKEEKEKWGKVEEIISNALLNANPLQITHIISEGIADIDNAKILTKLQLYIVRAKQSMDLVKCYIDSNEAESIKSYIEEVVSAIETFTSHAEEYRNQYDRLEKLDPIYDAVSQAVIHHDFKALIHNQNLTNKDEQKNNPYEEMLDITKEFESLAIRTAELHKTTYQSVLNQKRDVFRVIYKEIDREAERILSWGYRKGKKYADA